MEVRSADGGAVGVRLQGWDERHGVQRWCTALGCSFLQNNAPALDNIAWYGGSSSVNDIGRGWDSSGWTERQYSGGTVGPRRVGTKGANPWGLHDMIGNVFEWCADWYKEEITGDILNPTGPDSGVFRVLRGGTWVIIAAGCRAAYRRGYVQRFVVTTLVSGLP